MVRNQIHDYYLSQPTSSPPQLYCSLVPPVDEIPPHLFLPSSPPQLCHSLVPPVNKIPPPLLNSAALWYPQWTKYLLTSSPPQLHCSLGAKYQVAPTLLSGSQCPSGQNTPLTSSPPQLLTSSTPPLSGTSSGQNTSSLPQLRCSLVPAVDKIPPHLLTSSSPSHLLNSAALLYPQWTKYLLISSLPPSLLTSSTLPLSGTPSGQNTSSPPQLRHSLVPAVDKIPPHLLTSSSPSHLLNSAALWYPQWTKYLLISSPPQLCHSLVPQVDKIPRHLLNSTALGRPKWPRTCSLTTQMALSNAP